MAGARLPGRQNGGEQQNTGEIRRAPASQPLEKEADPFPMLRTPRISAV